MIWFCCWSCRTGKTYTGVAMAIKGSKEKQVKHYTYSAAVEAGENLSFSSWRYERKIIPICSRYTML
jgi:phosphate starvation-inducible protein PhoH